MNTNEFKNCSKVTTTSTYLITIYPKSGYSWVYPVCNMYFSSANPVYHLLSGGIYYIWYGNSYFGYYGSGISVYLSIYVPSSIAVGGNIYMTSSKKVKKI